MPGSAEVEGFELPAWECYGLLATTAVGRLCVIEHGFPIALPISFQLLQDGTTPRIVMRTAAHTMFAQYEGPASFEADEISQETHKAWSVLLRGQLRRIVGAHDLPDPHPWLAHGRFQWLVLDISAVSGRRFASGPNSDGFSVEWTFTA